jgi:glyoxylase-like metal-dependent hydrolase (beta-lactamase superfamily II)
MTLRTRRRSYADMEIQTWSEPAGRLDTATDTWSGPQPGSRHARAVERANAIRQALVAGSAVHAVQTFDLLSIVYPARFAFWGAATVPTPYVYLVHRATLLALTVEGRRARLLFNPTEPAGVLRAPFVTHLRQAYGPVAHMGWEIHIDLVTQLQAVGVTPEQIDYVAFDHFHLQHLAPAMQRFPRAQLIAQRREWQIWDAIHPVQRAFFLADGRHGVPEDRVTLIDGDIQLGDGAMLVRTPGHTIGNQTLFLDRRARHLGHQRERRVRRQLVAPREPDRRHRQPDARPGARCPAQSRHAGVRRRSLHVDGPREDDDPVPSRPELVQMMPSWEATRSLRSSDAVAAQPRSGTDVRARRTVAVRRQGLMRSAPGA